MHSVMPDQGVTEGQVLFINWGKRMNQRVQSGFYVCLPCRTNGNGFSLRETAEIDECVDKRRKQSLHLVPLNHRVIIPCPTVIYVWMGTIQVIPHGNELSEARKLAVGHVRQAVFRQVFCHRRRKAVLVWIIGRSLSVPTKGSGIFTGCP